MESVINTKDFLLVLPLLIPVIGGLCVAFVKALDDMRLRRIAVTAALVLTVAAVAAILPRPDNSLVLFNLTPEIPVLLKIDGVGRLYAGFISVVFACVGIYSFEYMHHEKNEKRFYAFYLFTLAALMGLSLCGSIVTLYMFYEAMTLLSLPLVTHTQTREAVAAGIKYLIYSVIGASLALAGIFFLNRYAVTLTFTAGGVLDMEKVAGHENMLLVVFFLMVLGFSVKAGMFPLHGWLPTAHPVAPAPASAVLSGVITKAGVLGIIRVIYDLVGPAFLRGTWVQTAWLVLAIMTVFLGSMLAFKEGVFKKRLAYSTVSQVSYVLFGLFTMTETGMTGALLHIIFHSIIKNTLFMTAGAIIYKTGKTKVAELTGIGKQMPVAMWCYTIVSMGLIGIPPTCGFISKWYLAQGGLSMAYGWNWVGPAVLLVSAILTAGYLFSIVIRGFFPGNSVKREDLPGAEPTWIMLAPMIVLACLCLGLGMFPTALTGFVGGIASSLM
ncbi:MAG: proton-conducting membrane transporter [Clostridia bacterium]|nr:proton-conducting membrane transporter [Clostridia bacterium]